MHDIMKRALQLFCACVALGGGVARAQEIAAPSNKLELSAGLGYGQGLGPVGRGVPTLQQLGNAGGTLQLNAGWRIDPRWEVGVYGEYGLYSSGSRSDSNHAVSAAAGIQGQFHALPAHRTDPWVGLGFGWRGYWGDVDSGKYRLQGLDLVRLQAGVDYRLTPSLAIGPVAGATVSYFLSEKAPGASHYSDTESRKADTFVFAGVGGRFDL
jgi:hypothetical protein